MGYSLEIFQIYSFKIWDFQVKLLANRGSTVWQVKHKKIMFWCVSHKRWHPPLSKSDTCDAYLIGFFLQYQNTTLHILYTEDNCSSNPHINPHLRSLLLLPWAREVKCAQWVAMGWTEFNFWRRNFPFCYHIHTSSGTYTDSYAMWKTYVTPTNAHSIIYVYCLLHCSYMFHCYYLAIFC